MKSIEVVAAIIFDEQGRIFATQRGYGEWKDWWEFPGGKMEAGETPQEALKREIHEELDAEIEVGEHASDSVSLKKIDEMTLKLKSGYTSYWT